ncbi:hypothetical protein [Candidatus Ferrigenium straubiae]|jgi:hypothetical protein|uniref:hypothetical protein n=1 Tax=Candidatus Ferrigenium straubiae TaxID=2919506 RepID=UPI003F4AB25A
MNKEAEFAKAGWRCATKGCADYAPTFLKLECGDSPPSCVWSGDEIPGAVGWNFPAILFSGNDGNRSSRVKVPC